MISFVDAMAARAKVVRVDEAFSPTISREHTQDDFVLSLGNETETVTGSHNAKAKSLQLSRTATSQGIHLKVFLE